jgi:hypothetical protein
MAYLPKQRPASVDAGPKMTLAEIADRIGKPAGVLRNLVARRKMPPLLVLYSPTRRYYSLLKVREMLRREERGDAH